MSGENNIPKHWQVKTLSEIGKCVTGTTPPKNDSNNYGNDIPFVKPPQLFDKQISDAPEKLSKKGADLARILPANSVLVTCIGNLGRTAINKIPVAFNQQINAIIPSKEIEGRYLFYQAQSHNFRKQLDELSSATTVAIVNKGKFETIKIVIPPLPEQQAIVSKIEELLSDLENGKQQLLTAQQQLKIYRQSLLKFAFDGRLVRTDAVRTGRDLSQHRDLSQQKDGELPKGWRIVTIIDLAEKGKHSLKAGPFGSSLKKEFYTTDGYKIYGQEQVISDNAFIGDYYVNEEKYQELRSCKIKPLDVLISLVGTVGKVLILPQNCKPGIINPRLIKISLNTEIYLPKFFKYYFESSYVKSLYGSKAQGTTMDVLNLGIIKTIPFPFPTLGEQQLIVDELESKLTVCDKLEEIISQSLLQAESLRQSILKKAFEGKLV